MSDGGRTSHVVAAWPAGEQSNWPTGMGTVVVVVGGSVDVLVDVVDVVLVTATVVLVVDGIVDVDVVVDTAVVSALAVGVPTAEPESVCVEHAASASTTRVGRVSADSTDRFAL